MAQMVLRMTVTAPWDGRDFEGANAARKIMAQAVHEIAAALSAKVSYEESVTNVRGKQETLL